MSTANVGHVSSVAPSHTPGPWEADGDTVVKFYGFRPDGDVMSRQIADASMCESDPEMRGVNYANASLIAAAPELLEALKAAKEDLETWHENAYPLNGGQNFAQCSGCETCETTLPAISAAISKAERG